MEQRREVSFSLPWPISVNQYWRGVRMGHRVAIHPSSEAKKYKDAVDRAVWDRFGSIKPIECDVEVEIVVVCPDRRKRDIDNLLKAPFDGLSEAGFWRDDSQVRRIEIRRSDEIEKPGRLDVRVIECVPEPERVLF